MGAGVPRPCSAKRANASTSPGTPARIIIAPMPRVSSRPRNGGRSCQPVIDHGTSPASVHGATTKKTAEPRTAMVRCTAVPDTRCELIPTSAADISQNSLDAMGHEPTLPQSADDDLLARGLVMESLTQSKAARRLRQDE